VGFFLETFPYSILFHSNVKLSSKSSPGPTVSKQKTHDLG